MRSVAPQGNSYARVPAPLETQFDRGHKTIKPPIFGGLCDRSSFRVLFHVIRILYSGETNTLFFFKAF